MIEFDQRECALQCSICLEKDGISEKAAKNEAALMLLTEGMAAQHRDCEKYADNPARAIAERSYKVRMRALMRTLDN